LILQVLDPLCGNQSDTLLFTSRYLHGNGDQYNYRLFEYRHCFGYVKYDAANCVGHRGLADLRPYFRYLERRLERNRRHLCLERAEQL